MKRVPELLAPAGSFESLKAAIKAGADSVYLSSEKFGARRYADNFNHSQLLEAVNYAHLRSTKVYVTVNTLIKESEVADMAEYLQSLYHMGVDAILIQDLGVLKIAREIVGELDLHASTQMTIHNEDGLKWAKKNGFKRVVLSRELSHNEITLLGDKTSLDLEVFLHGALCYGYSGQCLLSSVIGGRSGNRGICAQPCRKPYQLLKGEKDQYGRLINLEKIKLDDEYLLSTRDLSLYTNLKHLVESGIRCLKIEGRMRSPDYVFVVVSIYRKALDQISQGKWKPDTEDLEALKLVFNRGFTPGKMFNKSGAQFMGMEKPGHRGLLVGTVLNYSLKKKELQIDLESQIHPEKGDGIYFKPEDNFPIKGMDLNEAPVFKGKKMYLRANFPVKKGSKVYLSRKKDLMDLISTSDTSNVKRSAQTLNFSFHLDENNFPVLKGEVKGEETPGISSQVTGKKAMEKAIKKPLHENQIKKQLLKTGDKPFVVEIKNMDYPGGLFTPLSELNKLRREVIVDLETKIIESYRPGPEKIKKSRKSLEIFKNSLKNSSKPSFKSSPSRLKGDILPEVKLSAYVDEMDTLKSALESGVKRIYFEAPLLSPPQLVKKCIMKSKRPLQYSRDNMLNMLKEALYLSQSSSVQLVWKWPSITHPGLLKFFKDVLEKSPPELGIMVSHPGTADYIQKKYPDRAIYGSAALNIWNSFSLKKLVPLFSTLTLSGELSKKDLAELCSSLQEDSKDMELVVQGNIESLLSKEGLITVDLLKSLTTKTNLSSAYWALKDKKNHVFPVKIGADCNTVILNSVETCLVDYLPFLIKIGINNFALDARGKSGAYLKKMLTLYQETLSSLSSPDFKHDLKQTKRRIKNISQGGLTSGNFRRGLEK